MNNRLVRILFIGFIVISASMVLVGFIFQQSSVDRVSVIRIPTKADVFIDGESVGDSFKAKVGQSYQIVGIKDGWKTYEQTVTVSDINASIIVYLEPDSNEAYQWMIDNKKLTAEVEKVGGESAESDGRAFLEKYPIANYLTHKGGGYTITYGFKDGQESEGFYLLISSEYGFFSSAITKIYELGFDPADYSIIFSGPINPFIGDSKSE